MLNYQRDQLDKSNDNIDENGRVDFTDGIIVQKVKSQVEVGESLTVKVIAILGAMLKAAGHMHY